MDNKSILRLVLRILTYILPPIAIQLFLCLFFIQPNTESWFQYLNLPPFSPPNWLFTTGWTMIIALLALSWMVVQDTCRQPNSGVSKTKYYFTIAVHILMNLVGGTWASTFFGSQQLLAVSIYIRRNKMHAVCAIINSRMCDPLQGLLVIVTHDAISLINTIIFWRINWIGGVMCLPYLVWISYVTYVTFGCWQLN